MEIRRVQPSDREEYKKIVAEFYSSDAVMAPVDSEHFDRTFDELMRSDERAVCYFADCDGKIGGYALAVRFFSQEAGGEVIWLDEIYMRNKYRGEGIGTALISRVFADFPLVAAYRLEIEPENEGAERLYRRLGFEKLAYEQRILYKHKM